MLSTLRKAALLLSVPILVFAIYDVPIFYSRWRYTRNEERAARALEAEQARHTLAILGGFRISQFYASPRAIRKGEHTLICYGVYGAKSVRMEPPIETLQPALAHCLQVSPSVTTNYKLVAEDGSGHTANQELTIQVGR